MSATIVVVGGGYGGAATAKALDDVADVVLVEPRDAFVHNVAALRAAVDPGFLPSIFLPYDRLLSRGRMIRDRAVRVEPGLVTLAGGGRLHADFIVLATGSRYPFPAKSDVDDAATAQQKYRAVHASLAAAQRVLILGAGPVGLEMAGEITSVWPDKQVTVLDAAPDIINGPYRPELRQRVREQLDKRGVRLVLGDQLAELPATPAGSLGGFNAATLGGDTVSADVWLRCYGAAPVLDYLGDQLAEAATASGTLRVTEQLRVVSESTVFAVGDITAIDEPKMASRAGRHAAVVADTIRAAVTGTGEVPAYQPAPPVMLIPLGPDGGAAQLPGHQEIAGPELTAQYKGAHLFVARYAEMFGLAAAE